MTTPTPSVVLAPIALSEPAQLDLTAYRGDTGKFRVTVTQDGAPFDVSGATWDADIRATEDGPLVATMTVTPVVGQTNSVDVVLPADVVTPTATEGEPPTSEPFVGVWDLQMAFGVDPDVEVTTILRGQITMTRDVSRPLLELPDEPDPIEPPVLRGGLPRIGADMTPERVGGPDVDPIPDAFSLSVPESR